MRLGGGGNPHELNDGTDANGNFVTTVDPGIYEVRFYPPTPPTTTLLPASVTPVSIHGTVNMGTITLTLGVSLQGTVKNDANAPVNGVKIDVYNTNTEQLVLMKNNTTNAFGTFNLAVPKNRPLRAELLTSGVIGQTLAPQQIFGSLPGNTNMGTVVLHAGFHVTGTVHRENGTAVFGADVDAVDTTNTTLFTPNDNSNNLGNFDVVIPAGTYQFVFQHPTAQVLVDVELNNVAISAATNLGIITLRNGVFLTGSIVDKQGNPVVAADVNAIEVATGLHLALGGDNTDAAGLYSVVVPTGLLHVIFSPPGPHTRFDTDVHRDVPVTANTTVNGVLGRTDPLVGTRGGVATKGPIFYPLALGTPGTGGSVPHVEGHLASSSTSTSTVIVQDAADVSIAATAAGDEPVRGALLHLFGGRPGAPAVLLLGVDQHAFGSSSAHVVRPLARVPVTLDAEGMAALEVPLTLAGRTSFAQFLVHDPEARGGFALSEVLALQP